jgi:hypothetical protein
MRLLIINHFPQFSNADCIARNAGFGW